MIAGLIVGGALTFGIAFSLAYLLRRDLRAWIEQPKYRFHRSVQRYDRQQVASEAPPRTAEKRRAGSASLGQHRFAPLRGAKGVDRREG